MIYRIFFLLFPISVHFIVSFKFFPFNVFLVQYIRHTVLNYIKFWTFCYEMYRIPVCTRSRHFHIHFTGPYYFSSKSFNR